MKYWPLSVLAESPLMSPAFVWEFHRALAHQSDRLTPDAVAACGIVARSTAPQEMPSLAVVSSINAPMRRVFIDFPSWVEWHGLERSGVIEHNGNWYVLFDALH